MINSIPGTVVRSQVFCYGNHMKKKVVIKFDFTNLQNNIAPVPVNNSRATRRHSIQSKLLDNSDLE